MQTGAAGMEHRMLPPADLAKVLAAKAGAADGTHIVLYGDSPMQTGSIYMTLAATGHADDVSMLDGGINLWRAENRRVHRRAAGSHRHLRGFGRLLDVVIDAAYSRTEQVSPDVKVLDVRRRRMEQGHLPGAPILSARPLCQSADAEVQVNRRIRASIMKTGLTPNQSVVTYCAVGLRASLMYSAARASESPRASTSARRRLAARLEQPNREVVQAFRPARTDHRRGPGPGVHRDRRDDLAWAELLRQLRRGDDVERRRGAGEHALLLRQPPRHRARLGLVHGARFVTRCGVRCGGMNPAAIPSTRCGPPCPCVRSGADSGSSATIRAAQPPAFSAFDTPASMPAVPTAPQTHATCRRSAQSTRGRCPCSR